MVITDVSAGEMTRQRLELMKFDQLEGGILSTMVAGNTLYYRNDVYGSKEPKHYVPGGIVVFRSGNVVVQRKWQIERDMLCEKNSESSREVCKSVFRRGNRGVLCDEDSDICPIQFEWKLGDTEGLGG